MRDALHDSVVGPYIKKVQYDELMQTLNLPMEELQQFAADVLERFDNPYVDHHVTSIMLNSFPKFQLSLFVSSLLINNYYFFSFFPVWLLLLALLFL